MSSHHLPPVKRWSGCPQIVREIQLCSAPSQTSHGPYPEEARSLSRWQHHSVHLRKESNHLATWLFVYFEEVCFHSAQIHIWNGS